MVEENRPRLGLGRGLAALMGENTLESASSSDAQQGQRKVPIEFLRPNPKNPRRVFEEESLEELSGSIREKGIIQPILVRNVPNSPNNYEIIAGERRWRAAQKAGVHEVPIVLVDVSDREALEIAIVENVQRSDLNPLDEARAYEQLASDFGYTQADLSRIIGKSRSHIANLLRLLKLPAYTRQLLETGALSAGHGRTLLAFADIDGMARRAVEEGLSVRELEKLSQDPEPVHANERSKNPPKEKDADTRMLERTLSEALGLTVDIKATGEKGQLTVKFKNLEQLDQLCAKLRN